MVKTNSNPHCPAWHTTALGSRLWEHMQEHCKAFTDEDRKRLAWWMDSSCPLEGGYGNYYEDVDGVRWPIHQDVDPYNPLGVERLEDLQ